MKPVMRGGRIFIGGCGATGRLALSIETILRKDKSEQDIVSFMAGGDFALIKSIEQFEDRMSYGAKQLEELNFSENDLFIGCTEGGETPFVIGATMHAADHSKRSPFFIYCNPDEQLMHLQRCTDIIASGKINRLCMEIGPQALSGSTRMQASSAIMFVVGMALMYSDVSYADFIDNCKQTLIFLENLDYLALKNFIELETNYYKANAYVTYQANPDLAIAVLTDTTERSPTFSLPPFERKQEEDLSLCYLSITGESDAESAWMSLLERVPRGLDWTNLEQDLSLTSIFSFDISEQAIHRRSSQCGVNKVFNISKDDDYMTFNLGGHIHHWKIEGYSLLVQHLALKMLLNTHSTIVMGAVGRYTSNVMTYVKTSNNKLIDRAARYVQLLLKQDNIKIPYQEIIRSIFNHKENVGSDESIVMTVYTELKQQKP
jgi:N-acetylmuramic acid 6-phosphate etherase